MIINFYSSTLVKSIESIILRQQYSDYQMVLSPCDYSNSFQCITDRTKASSTHHVFLNGGYSQQ